MATNEKPVVRIAFITDPADGALRLGVGDVAQALRMQGVDLRDGLQIELTDGEFSVNAMLVWARSGWHVVVC